MMSDATNADGTWNVIIETPMGPQQGRLVLETEDGELFGTSEALGDTVEIDEGTVDGDRIGFSIKVKRPIPMTLVFDLAVTVDALAGTVLAGTLGEQKVTGVRA
jgi:hypothetical protein